jgi:hypothetical protein
MTTPCLPSIVLPSKKIQAIEAISPEAMWFDHFLPENGQKNSCQSCQSCLLAVIKIESIPFKWSGSQVAKMWCAQPGTSIRDLTPACLPSPYRLRRAGRCLLRDTEWEVKYSPQRPMVNNAENRGMDSILKKNYY